jgi:hypothetical protein
MKDKLISAAEAKKRIRALSVACNDQVCEICYGQGIMRNKVIAVIDTLAKEKK